MLYRAAFWCFVAQLAWIGTVQIYILATGSMQIETKTLIMGALGELPGVLAQYSKLSIVITDWLNTGPDTRIIGFGVYATEGALLVLLAGLLAAIHAGARRRWLLLIAIEVMIAVALVEMASRTTLLAYLISLGLMAALSVRRVSTALLLLTPVLAAGALIAAIYGPGLPQERLLGGKPGSRRILRRALQILFPRARSRAGDEHPHRPRRETSRRLDPDHPDRLPFFLRLELH
jgi:hypothetical protein